MVENRPVEKKPRIEKTNVPMNSHPTTRAVRWSELTESLRDPVNGQRADPTTIEQVGGSSYALSARQRDNGRSRRSSGWVSVLSTLAVTPSGGGFHACPSSGGQAMRSAVDEEVEEPGSVEDLADQS